MKILVIISLMLLSGCVTPAVTQHPVHRIDFSQFGAVAYKVHASEAVEYGDGEIGLKYGHDTIALIDSLLSARLTQMGHKVVAQTDNHDLEIDINVTAAKPGSAAARFWVGFGAGRAVTLFDAKFTRTSGAALASFQGGRSFTGMEWNVSPFAGKSDISASAATRCVDQIETFMANGGDFPTSKDTSPVHGVTN